MKPPTGCEDWPDYVEHGRIAADLDEQREREERMREAEKAGGGSDGK